ncbi:hypothetical protein HDF16_005977 [Granulicella aggregans]|uniref:Uncharacterized protein n=1 Tax=Granulicella aggregans TaxID=474949 RepID=A0A7W7ZL57_9BACT|nr:hypothetical protein [Granulicella aggregans]MBB5061241.1 hypothetical protein [Granulicella aggregans]
MAMNYKKLLDLWEMDEMPACGEGMKLAEAFLIAAGEGVNRLGVEEPEDRITELTAAYMALVEHGDGCDNCNESNLPERDDIPADPIENDPQYQADRKIGFQAGLDGQGSDDSKSHGWQRGWADAQE